MNTLLNSVAKSEYSDITGPGIDYTIDPYLGCEHACKYCYVFRRQFVDDPTHTNDLWGDFVDPIVGPPVLRDSDFPCSRTAGAIGRANCPGATVAGNRRDGR